MTSSATEADFEEQIRLQKIVADSEAEGHAKTRKDDDGTEYEWDAIKKAWFPKIDAEFLAKYQLNYGISEVEISADEAKSNVSSKTDMDYTHFYQWFNYAYPNEEERTNFKEEEMAKAYQEYLNYYYDKDGKLKNSTTSEDQNMDDSFKSTKNVVKTKDKKKAEVKPEQEGWLDLSDSVSNSIYLTNLPLDITLDELENFVKKVGLLQHDIITNKPKLKLYKDHKGNLKGDGRCTYMKPESVDLALKILDESILRGSKIKVEVAQFNMKGEYDPSKKKRKLTTKEKKKLQVKKEKLLGWIPESPKLQTTIILKNVFEPSELSNPLLIKNLHDDIYSECQLKYGPVKKLTVHSHHIDGIVQITFKDNESAEKCLNSLNGRWYAKRQITAEYWDRTNYKKEETEEERKLRDEKWHKFLTEKEETE